MKNLLMAAAIASLAGGASADVYTDSTGELFDNGFAHLDILQVEVTNDATFLYFDITVGSELDTPTITNWGKYLVGMDTGREAGTTTGAWGRNISWGAGITDFIGSWADDGGSGAGGELYALNGGVWSLTDATYNAGTEIVGDDSGHAAGVQRMAVTLAALGLSIGDTIEFDVASTGGGGGDPGVDHLSRSDMSTPGWGDASASGDFNSYTIVPAPSSMALLGLGGLVAGRRRR